VTRCNVCVLLPSSPSLHLLIPHLRLWLLMPPRELVVKLSALELKISPKDGRFPSLFCCFYRIPPLTLTLPPLSLSFSLIPFPGLLWQIIKIQHPLSHIFVENHPELVVLLQEAEDMTSLLRLLAQLLIRNALALGTEIFLEPQGIGSGDQKLNMSFDFGSLESGGDTGILKLQDLARQPHGVVIWKK
jgi:hypothetical protein